MRSVASGIQNFYEGDTIGNMYDRVYWEVSEKIEDCHQHTMFNKSSSFEIIYSI